ncbi:hypothetical protein FIBSPDRAFT_1008199 [Athelia psychrophila]|uniref:Uncharacterized protein n=1 Tax=Athelia psychrophila TaxID=1759441 RepID=A0A166NXT0_9AGAM|nr:hypothetical protein FIBSPDRAFT_1008199 [Fibularhizoctonia sp. CBS 109695]
MPRPTAKAARVKHQYASGVSKFGPRVKSTAEDEGSQYKDLDPEHNIDSELSGNKPKQSEEESDTEDNATAMQKLYSIFMLVHLQSHCVQNEKQRLSNRAVYTKGSRTTQWCHKKNWAKAAEKLVNIATLFEAQLKRKRSLSSPDRQLMSKGEMDCDIDYVPDPNYDWEADLLDFCIEKLDAGIDRDKSPANNIEFGDEAFKILEREAENIAENSPQDEQEDIVRAKIVLACELFKDEELEQLQTIKEIVAACLKDVKKVKTGRSLKMVTRLTAVIEYVNLRECYQAHVKSKRPHLTSSIIITWRMGKGVYFA